MLLTWHNGMYPAHTLHYAKEVGKKRSKIPLTIVIVSGFLPRKLKA
jgi:hypothetical protein